MNIGDNIRIARKQRGLNQQSLGDLVGLSRATIVNIEKNKHNLNSDKIQQFCKILSVTPNYLLGIDSNKESEYYWEKKYLEVKSEMDILKSNIKAIIKTVSI